MVVQLFSMGKFASRYDSYPEANFRIIQVIIQDTSKVAERIKLVYRGSTVVILYSHYSYTQVCDVTEKWRGKV